MITKKTYYFTRIICDISDYAPNWGPYNAGELTHLLELHLGALAKVSLGLAKWQIDYDPAFEAEVNEVLQDFKKEHSHSEYYIGPE